MVRKIDASEIVLDPDHIGHYYRTKKSGPRKGEKMNLPALFFSQHKDKPFEIVDDVEIYVPSSKEPFRVIIVKVEPEVVGILQGLIDA